jgi:hypothetical protein
MGINPDVTGNGRIPRFLEREKKRKRERKKKERKNKKK